MPNGERMCAAIWRSSWRPSVQDAVGRVAKIDLAAHDRMAEQVARGEPLARDACRVLRILVARGDDVRRRALEIAEAARRPVSRSALMAASECCGE